MQIICFSPILFAASKTLSPFSVLTAHYHVSRSYKATGNVKVLRVQIFMFVSGDRQDETTFRLDTTTADRQDETTFRLDTTTADRQD
jgi:hypothetical protein